MEWRFVMKPKLRALHLALHQLHLRSTATARKEAIRLVTIDRITPAVTTADWCRPARASFIDSGAAVR